MSLNSPGRLIKDLKTFFINYVQSRSRLSWKRVKVILKTREVAPEIQKKIEYIR